MLSILICTMPARQRQLNQLLTILEPQVHKQPVSIIIESDDGTMSIGTKRNKLMDRADRKYVAYIDDDDAVDPAYVALILKAIKEGNNPDCIGICGWIVDGGQYTWQFRHSISVSRWCKEKKNRIYFRTPNHLNPIRTELARKVRFPEKSWGEDRAFSDGIRPHLKTERFIEYPLYYYQRGNH